MKDILLGGLIGYGIAWALSTSQGQQFMGNARRGLSSLETKLGKDVETKSKDKKEVEESKDDESNS